MDPVQTAFQILVPSLPYLYKVGEKTAEGAINKMGEDCWIAAKQLWQKIGPKMNSKPTAQEAIDNLLKAPDDDAAQLAFRLQLKKLFAEDVGLTKESIKIFQDVKIVEGKLVGANMNMQEANIPIEIHQDTEVIRQGGEVIGLNRSHFQDERKDKIN